MRRYCYRYETVDCFDSDVCHHQFKLRCVPTDDGYQHLVEHHLHISPCNQVNFDVDSFGNAIQYGGQAGNHNFFAFVSRGVVEQQVYAIPESTPSLMYQIPSSLTSVNAEMMKFLKETVRCHPSDRAFALCHAVNRWMDYRPGVTGIETKAQDAFNVGAGVCQDFAHVMIALCRASGLLARYVNGFLEGTGATHAWVEVYDDGVWRGLDPTNDCSITYGYVKVAHGRDANDCPVNRGVYTGCANHHTEINVTVSEL